MGLNLKKTKRKFQFINNKKIIIKNKYILYSDLYTIKIFALITICKRALISVSNFQPIYPKIQTYSNSQTVEHHSSL